MKHSKGSSFNHHNSNYQSISKSMLVIRTIFFCKNELVLWLVKYTQKQVCPTWQTKISKAWNMIAKNHKASYNKYMVNTFATMSNDMCNIIKYCVILGWILYPLFPYFGNNGIISTKNSKPKYFNVSLLCFSFGYYIHLLSSIDIR